MSKLIILLLKVHYLYVFRIFLTQWIYLLIDAALGGSIRKTNRELMSTYILGWCKKLVVSSPCKFLGPLKCLRGGLCLSRSIGDRDIAEFIIPVPHVKQVKVSLVIKLNLFLFLLKTFLYSWSSAIFCLWAACNFKWWSLGCSFHWISFGMQSRIGSGISSSTNCQSMETKNVKFVIKYYAMDSIFVWH